MLNPRSILANFAVLPQSDQHWLIRKLSWTLKKRFLLSGGASLLRKKKTGFNLELPNTEIRLPSWCTKLREEHPLHIAIILQQGAYSWSPLFLQTCTNQEEINHLAQQQVPQIKEPIKNMIFNQWLSRQEVCS